MKKRILSLTLTTILSIANINLIHAEELSLTTQPAISVQAEKTFKDLSSKHWAYKDIQALAQKGFIDGYADGTFKPDEKVNVDEALKLLVTALGYKVEKKEGYWAEPYINKAIELGIGNSYSEYARPITRVELANYISEALSEVLKENYPSNMNDYKLQIRDLRSLDNHYDPEDILKVYTKGIMTGFADGTFKYDDNVSRAEICTILNRLLDPSQRKIPKLQKSQQKSFVAPIINTHYEYASTMYSYYTVKIDNIQEYSNDYQFKIENITRPEFNIRCPEWGTSIYKIDITRWQDAKKVNSMRGELYTLYKNQYAPREIAVKYPLKRGMKLQYKIIIKKGTIQKVYYTTAIIPTYYYKVESL